MAAGREPEHGDLPGVLAVACGLRRKSGGPDGSQLRDVQPGRVPEPVVGLDTRKILLEV